MDGTGYEYLPKALIYASSQLATGLVIVRWLLRDADLGGSAERTSAERWFSGWAVVNSGLLLAGLLLRAWGHTVVAFGTEDAWRAGNLRLVALESRWGLNWQWQVYAAVLLLGGAVVARRHKIGWPLYAAGALSLTLVMPLLGHAAGSAARHALHAAHILAGAAWIGSLGVMALMTLSGQPMRSHPDLLARAVQRFSPIALTAASVVMASGLVAAWLYVGSVHALWSTDYGRILISKVAMVGVVLLCGRQNWQQARSHRPPVKAVIVLEYLAALCVAALTAVLTETEHP